MCSVLDEIGAFNQRRGQYAAAEHCLSSVRDFPSAIHSRHCERSPAPLCTQRERAHVCACAAGRCGDDAVGSQHSLSLSAYADAQVLMRAGPVSTIVGLAFNGCAASPPKTLKPQSPKPKTLSPVICAAFALFVCLLRRAPAPPVAAQHCGAWNAKTRAVRSL